MKNKKLVSMIFLLFLIVLLTTFLNLPNTNIAKEIKKKQKNFIQNSKLVKKVMNKSKGVSSSLFPFPYEKYWARQARLARLEPSQVPSYQPYSDCLKVYVYNLSKAIQGPLSFSQITEPEWTNKHLFHPKSSRRRPYEFETHQSYESALFFYRLFVDNERWKERERERERERGGGERGRGRGREKGGKEEDCFLTDDPEKADLFLIPLFLDDGKWGIEQCRNDSIRNKVRRTIMKETKKIFTSETSCGHVMIHSQAIHNTRACRGFFSKPARLFQFSLRVGGSPIFKKTNFPNYRTYWIEDVFFEQVPNEFPYLVPIPHPSSVHWSTEFTVKPPWAVSDSPRSILMLYTTFNKLHGDIPVRQKIANDCARYDDKRICTVDHLKQIHLKGNATFCLEPMGDNPWRKSIVDSITFGCIPVLFSQITDGMAPYHWQGWRNRTRVLISRWDYLSGKIDLQTLLESIPASHLKLLQKSIEKIGKRFQTSLHHDPGDSHSLVLRGLVEQKKRCESLKDMPQKRVHKKVVNFEKMKNDTQTKKTQNTQTKK